MKFYVESPGDPTVGIWTSQAAVEADVNENDADWVQMAKEILQDAFIEIFDNGDVIVITESERKAIEDQF